MPTAVAFILSQGAVLWLLGQPFGSLGLFEAIVGLLRLQITDCPVLRVDCNISSEVWTIRGMFSALLFYWNSLTKLFEVVE
jgi:hypothetical protein